MSNTLENFSALFVVLFGFVAHLVASLGAFDLSPGVRLLLFAHIFNSWRSSASATQGRQLIVVNVPLNGFPD
jgi:hypothetical protein